MELHLNAILISGANYQQVLEYATQQLQLTVAEFHYVAHACDVLGYRKGLYIELEGSYNNPVEYGFYQSLLKKYKFTFVYIKH